MFSRQVERMIDALAKCTYNNAGCNQYGTYCEKGYNGILAKFKIEDYEFEEDNDGSKTNSDNA